MAHRQNHPRHPPKPAYANQQALFVNTTLFTSTLRKTRADLTRRNTLVGLIAAGLLLGISGPFDTFALLSTPARLAYWLCVTVSTFALGTFSSTLIATGCAHRPPWLRHSLSIALTTLTVTAFLTALNAASFGLWPRTLGQAAAHLGFVAAISAVIEIGSALIHTPDKPTAPALLARLPLDKRGPLISLSVSDHYVSVTTTKGSELLLMRLSDAITETAPCKGLQIHRSHWAALDRIASVKRHSDRATLTLSNGTTLPVSRSFLPAVRDAGLLPR